MNQTNSNQSGSNNSAVAGVQENETGEQKVILLPRKNDDRKTFWIGVLAKYFDIWAPTSPVRLKEIGTQFTFDFYSESDSKLIKIFTIYDADTIASYLNLSYAKHILFILDFQITDCELSGHSDYCGECRTCTYAYEVAEEVDAYICLRDGHDIKSIMERDEEGQWNEISLAPY